MDGNHQFTMTDNAILVVGKQASYVAHGGHVQYLLSNGLFINIEEQAKLICSDHTFCLIQQPLVVAERTSITLRLIFHYLSEIFHYLS